ncbi:MAG: hypothetical protein QOJ15_4577, partial [Bradyrhizobium sp.]|nr:hypothetical protein [Bradyrhizobium sp.]
APIRQMPPFSRRGSRICCRGKARLLGKHRNTRAAYAACLSILSSTRADHSGATPASGRYLKVKSNMAKIRPTSQREFREELGVSPRWPLWALSEIRQRGGKIVHAFAVEGDLNIDSISSNTFEWNGRPEADSYRAFRR